MRLSAHIKESMVNLLSAKLRSFLAILGVLVGTASVVALVSGGQLATEHALSQFSRLGTDLLSATIQDTSRERTDNIKDVSSEDVAAIADMDKHIVSASPYAVDFSPITFNGMSQHGNVVGVTENLETIMKLNTIAGRFISDFDGKERFAVIGGEIAQKLLAPNQTLNDLIGQQIQTGQNYYTIVGILEPSHENMFFLVNINNAVLVPLEAALGMSKTTKINNVVFKIHEDADIGDLKERLGKSFQAINPQSRLYFRSPQEIITSMKSQNRTFTLLLGFIGSISLIVGGIGVMNIMLVSVVERRREIGIRLAVGAKQKDILLMFLSESVTLTLFGGLLGVMLGELVAFVTAHFSGWAFHVYSVPLFIGFSVSALVGMFFGIYPAHKASQSDPILCLRSD